MIPEWIKYKRNMNEKSRVWFLDCRGTGFKPESYLWQERINSQISHILDDLHSASWKEPVLMKCHIGEEKCRTRLLPQFCLSTVEHFIKQGMKRIVAGDSTVAYSGKRGYRENGVDCSSYLHLAQRHGWSKKGALGVPFVILDRPSTSKDGGLIFTEEEAKLYPKGSKYFKSVYMSGGFAAAGTIINHVHFTLHDMAQIASAVKGITMGGSSYKGKLIMHKCYFPLIDREGCKKCGLCALNCPEHALKWQEGRVPEVDREDCIGCGECSTVCQNNTITLMPQVIKDWLKGSDTLAYRMADYIIGMMENRWDRLLNIVHMYNITRRCDCLNKSQKPIISDIGFVVGKNPFAVDFLCTSLLCDEVYKAVQDGRLKGNRGLCREDILQCFFKSYNGFEPYRYIQKGYGIVVEPEPVHIRFE